MLKYNFKEDIFSIIDCGQKAYWIGFLYADGSIESNSHTISCTLKEDDKEQLINFETFLNISESCLKYNNATHSWRFTVTRLKTYQDLINIGFTSEKSYDKTLIVWNHIPEKFKKDFLLGLWDGDGSFMITSDKKQKASLISNNDYLIWAIVKYINNNLGKDFCKIKPRIPSDPYPRIQIGYNKAKIFGDWLYKDINYPILQRKYNIYKQMHVGTKAHIGWDNNKTKGVICIDNGNKYATVKECCIAEFGIDNPGALNNIRLVCRGERKQTRGKHFRYMTEEERKEMQNG